MYLMTFQRSSFVASANNISDSINAVTGVQGGRADIQFGEEIAKRFDSKSDPLRSALGQSLPIDMTATCTQCPLHLQ
jgi:hypothetical protein